MQAQDAAPEPLPARCAGSFPPGKVARLGGCGRHLLNMLRAHTQAYNAIKAMPGAAAALCTLRWSSAALRHLLP